MEKEATKKAAAPRRVRRFTDAVVRNIRPTEKRFTVWAPNGLGLRVSPSGVKSWIYVYTIAGRVRWHKLGEGHYPGVSVAEAHRLHGAALALRGRGIDPGAVSKGQLGEGGVLRVKDLSQRFLREYTISKGPHKGERKAPRSQKEDARLLAKNVIPVIGSRPAGSVKAEEVEKLLEKILQAGAPIAANRVFSVMRTMFNWAVKKRLIETSPCAGVDLPARERERERFLSAEEIRALLLGLKAPELDMAETMRLALRLSLATAARPGEICGARLVEIDFRGAVWTIPPERTKSGRGHSIPLSRYALRIAEAARAASRGSEYLFPSDRGAESIRPSSLSHALARSLPALGLQDVHPHDLRRTVATHVAGDGKSNPGVIVAMLNHRMVGVTRVYQRHSYAPEVRSALDRWGQRLEELGRGKPGRRERNKTVVVG